MAVSFDFRRRLGSGNFGEVWEARETGLDRTVALKCIPPAKILNQKNFFQEAQTLQAAAHPNIVEVLDTGTLHDGRIYVAMEYLKRGSLEDLTQGAILGLSQTRKVMIDVLRGLAHAHSIGIIHRDIKPANIMIGSAGEGQLSDFGLALPDLSKLDPTQLKEYQYVLHLAPEIRGISDFSVVSDIYACGVTLFRLVNGDVALPQVAPGRIQKMARQGEFPPRDAYRDFVPRSMRRLINKALSVDPMKRYTSADALRHAVEAQDFRIDWEESVGQQRVMWTGRSLDGYSYQVIKEIDTGPRWRIVTCRAKDKAPPLSANIR